MTTPSVDDRLQTLRDICEQFRAFCDAHGAVTEADTRSQVIDRILVEVCGWPAPDILRERHVERGYMDYCLKIRDTPYVAVEAKREGIPFIFPIGSTTKRLKLSGVVSTHADIREAITQVRGYCDDQGIRYAVATNGYAWIIFRAIREGLPWRDGMARIFPTLEYIIQNFMEFWNLLSYDALLTGSLDTEFGSPRRPARELHRVVDRLFNADQPLQRNRLHAQLHPLIKAIFEDIADQDAPEILQSCYVHSASLRIVVQDLSFVITDSIPRFLRDQGAEPIRQGAADAGAFATAISSAIASPSGQLFLLLGGIGAGKTTFLKRYQRTVGHGVLSASTIWFHVDFLAAILDPRDMEAFVWRTILDQLRSRYKTPHLETRRNIKRVFSDEIAALQETALSGLRPESPEYDRALSPYLQKWQETLSEYVPRLLRLCKPRQDISVVIFIDNVDQLSPSYQAQVFMLAQRVTRLIGSVTVVALREESYYTASVQKTFTAYTNRKFHIASPQFRKLIVNRLRFAREYLTTGQEALPFAIPGGITIDATAISDFLEIVEYSIFERNRNIALFIEAICFGNMRMALNLFTTFLASGATDVDKMLRIHRRDGAYFVAFHEFVKSIMLGDRRFYREAHSPVLNLFDCGSEKNSSHFTAVRILRMLLGHRGEVSREGQGYTDLNRIISAFEDIFDDREDVLRTLERLLVKQLIEANTRSTESLAGATHVRITSAGWYYLRSLVRSFPYLDLVLQDTPINDSGIERDLRDSVHRVDNLADREEEKLARMEIRFDRVGQYLDYLHEEENIEIDRFSLTGRNTVITDPIVPGIRDEYERQRTRIEERLRANRERFEEEIVLEVPPEEESILLPRESEDAAEDADVAESGS